jgi:hypothetical protein
VNIEKEDTKVLQEEGMADKKKCDENINMCSV